MFINFIKAKNSHPKNEELVNKYLLAILKNLEKSTWNIEDT